MIKMVWKYDMGGNIFSKRTGSREILPKITNTAARELQDSGIV